MRLGRGICATPRRRSLKQIGDYLYLIAVVARDQLSRSNASQQERNLWVRWGSDRQAIYWSTDRVHLKSRLLDFYSFYGSFHLLSAHQAESRMTESLTTRTDSCCTIERIGCTIISLSSHLPLGLASAMSPSPQSLLCWDHFLFNCCFYVFFFCFDPRTIILMDWVNWKSHLELDARLSSLCLSVLAVLSAVDGGYQECITHCHQSSVGCDGNCRFSFNQSFAVLFAAAAATLGAMQMIPHGEEPRQTAKSEGKGGGGRIALS